MNKVWLILCAALLASCLSGFGQSSTRSPGWYGTTSLGIGTLHAGSYRKERSIILLEQEFGYRFGEKFSAGAGTGIDLYPGALALPLYLTGAYFFEIKELEFNLQTSLGGNLRVADPFFSSYRNVSSIGVSLLSQSRVQLVPRLGYVLNLDRYVGGSLSALIGLDLRYGL